MSRRSDSPLRDDASSGRKRRKVEEIEPDATHLVSQPNPPAELLSQPRHEKLWFRDGTVIVLADGMSFKVHAGILEHHSTVFKNLLDTPGNAAQEVAEGCPVLRLTDSGPELGELFLILYDGGRSPFFNRKIPIVFRTLRSLTFLAVKYEVQHVIAEATARLEVVFPVRFEDKRVEWNALDTVVEDSPIRGLKLGDAVTAVCLARAIDAEEPPAFIVMALYFCCQIQPDHLLENPAEDDNLSRADLSACLFGSLALARSNSHTKNSIFDFSGDGVCSSKACRSARWRTIRAWTSDHVFSGTTALDSIKHWGETEVTESGSLCDRCDEKLHSMYDARRRDAFNQLGEIFGVPGWPLPDN